MTHSPLTLLDELETIDAALLDGTATPQQEARGQHIVSLANAAPDLLNALSDFFNIMHDYESSVRKGYIRHALENARTAIAKAEGE